MVHEDEEVVNDEEVVHKEEVLKEEMHEKVVVSAHPVAASPLFLQAEGDLDGPAEKFSHLSAKFRCVLRWIFCRVLDGKWNAEFAFWFMYLFTELLPTWVVFRNNRSAWATLVF